MRVAINGFGRICRSVFRILDKRADAELVAINDVFDHDALRYLLNYDTVMGRVSGTLRLEGDEVVTSHGRTRMLREKDPLKLPWRELGIDGRISHVLLTGSYASSALNAAASWRVCSSPPPT